jgi:hypothetical protein
MYENRTLKPAEAILRRGREKGRIMEGTLYTYTGMTH